MEGLAREGRRKQGFAIDTTADQVDQKHTTDAHWGPAPTSSLYILSTIKTSKYH